MKIKKITPARDKIPIKKAIRKTDGRENHH